MPAPPQFSDSPYGSDTTVTYTDPATMPRDWLAPGVAVGGPPPAGKVWESSYDFGAAGSPILSEWCMPGTQCLTGYILIGGSAWPFTPCGAFLALNSLGGYNDYVFMAKWAGVKQPHPGYGTNISRGDCALVTWTKDFRGPVPVLTDCSTRQLQDAPCCPGVMVFTPNLDPETGQDVFNNAAYGVYGAPPPDKDYGLFWQGLGYGAMGDPSSQANPPPLIEARCEPPPDVPPPTFTWPTFLRPALDCCWADPPCQ